MYENECLGLVKEREKKRKHDSSLLVVRDEEDEIKPEKMPKRNGGVQEVNLCTIMNQMNNNNKQLYQKFDQKFAQLDNWRKEVNQGIDKLDQRITNKPIQHYNNFSQPHRQSNYIKFNRNHPYQRSGKSIGFYNNRSSFSQIDKSCYKCGANNHLQANCPHVQSHDACLI